jgi:hypothetical protein
MEDGRWGSASQRLAPRGDGLVLGLRCRERRREGES